MHRESYYFYIFLKQLLRAMVVCEFRMILQIKLLTVSSCTQIPGNLYLKARLLVHKPPVLAYADPRLSVHKSPEIFALFIMGLYFLVGQLSVHKSPGYSMGSVRKSPEIGPGWPVRKSPLISDWEGCTRIPGNPVSTHLQVDKWTRPGLRWVYTNPRKPSQRPFAS
jgi:hypothetical protein